MPASSVLTQLCQLAELWEMICGNLTGDSLITMSQVNIFAHATAMTPAFQLLAGLTYIDTHTQFTIATIIDEIDEMQRYLCEDVGDFYLCHIRPALLSPSLPCPCDRCVKNRENNPVHGIPPHDDDE